MIRLLCKAAISVSDLDKTGLLPACIFFAGNGQAYVLDGIVIGSQHIENRMGCKADIPVAVSNFAHDRII